MSLLDKATTITTPTAHSNGILYSIKGGSVADFDVVRGSAATRVNAEGLIEDISVLSGELVTNGDFSNGSTGWFTVETSPNIVQFQSNQVYLNRTISAANELFRNPFTIGKKYKIQIQASIVSSGVAIEGNGDLTRTNLVSGTNTFYLTATSIRLSIICTNNTSEGYIESVSIKEITEDTDIPRIDYTDGGCPSLLLEPQSTNLLTYSEDFNNAIWLASSSAELSATSTITPSGGTNAVKVKNTGVSNTDLKVVVPIILGENYTSSAYIRRVSGSGQAYIKNVNGAQTNISLTSEWKRFSTSVLSISTDGRFFIGVDGLNDEIEVWGAQLEALPHATSYIPTSGAIATRLADSVTGAGDATTFNSTEGVLYFEGSAFVNGGVNRYISLSDNTTSNRVQLVFASATNRLQVSGTNIPSINYNSFVQTDNNKIAFSYSASGVRLFVNGVLVGSNTDNASLPTNTLTTLDFTLWNQTSLPFFGKVKSLITFDTALTDAELECITLPDGATLLNGENMADVGDSLLDQNGTQPILIAKYYIASNQSLSVGGKRMVSGDTDSVVNQIQGITNSPKLILIGGGTNDFYGSVPIGNLNSTDTTEYCGAVSFVLDYAIANYPDATILKLGLPFGNLATAGTSADGQTNSSGLTRSDYMDAEKQLCEDRNIVYVNQLEELGWNASNILDKTYDGIHPIAEGSQDRADLFSTYIDELFPPIN